MQGCRSLHLCNLANVAYGYCKLLVGEGAEVSLRCHDLTHLMSQPEWDDLELRAEDFPNELDFFDNTADFGDYQRPEWFRSVGIMPQHFRQLANGDEPTTAVARMQKAGWRSMLTGWRSLPQGLRRPVKSRLRAAAFAYSAWRSDQSTLDTYSAYKSLSAERFDTLIEESKAYGPDFEITREMLGAFQPHAWWTREHARAMHADVVFSYVLTPIYSMLLGSMPYVSIEIGTMREIPFDGTDTGRLLALAYRLSPHVLITNPDVVAQAKDLGVESYSFCPHPLDEDVYRPMAFPDFRRQLLQENDADLLLFAPARQNWEIKRNDRYLRAFARLVKEDEARAALIIPAWGQEIERSQRLCKDLGIEEHVNWIQPQSEAMLVKYYAAADFVLDQFELGVFGLTTPKAMSCGAVVVSSYHPELHDWCFDEHPPLVAAKATEEIYRALSELARNPDRRAQLGEQGRQWILSHHSKSRIRKTLDEAAQIAQERHRRTL